jgi:hypothetical protein
MHRSHIPPHPRLTACLLLFALSGCSSSTTAPTEEAPPPNFEGSYSLTGTYSGRDGVAVDGTMDVTGQSGTTATARVAIKLMDHGATFFALNTPSDAVAATSAPGTAQLGSAGLFSLALTGREEVFGIDPAACCAYTLTFKGALSDNTLSGTWTLTTDQPSSDKGTFTAVR